MSLEGDSRNVRNRRRAPFVTREERPPHVRTRRFSNVIPSGGRMASARPANVVDWWRQLQSFVSTRTLRWCSQFTDCVPVTPINCVLALDRTTGNPFGMTFRLRRSRRRAENVARPS